MYVIEVDGYIECSACNLQRWFYTKDTTEMLVHLLLHRALGDDVPDKVLLDVANRVDK